MLFRGIVKRMKYPKTDLENRALKRVLDYALSEGASEIYLELDDPGRIRFRTNGLLADVFDVEENQLRSVVDALMRYAQMADDDTGQFTHQSVHGTTRFDAYRFVAPFGEQIVLRPTTAPEATFKKLSDLDLSATDKQMVREHLVEPGIIIVSGPTDIAVTLIALAHALSSERRSVVAIDTTVQQLPDDIQQIKTCRGFETASALRALLRHRPDVIVLGTLPDAETAGLASHAAYGGATVLAGNPHEDCLKESVFRNAINLGIAERRVPRVCEACNDTYPLNTHERLRLEKMIGDHPLREQLDTAQTYRSRGCGRCRIGNAPLCGIFAVGAGDEALDSSGVKRLLATDGLAKALDGLVSIDDVLKIA